MLCLNIRFLQVVNKNHWLDTPQLKVILLLTKTKANYLFICYSLLTKPTSLFGEVTVKW